MTQRKVDIVELPAMRVASALGFGKEPEMQASTMIHEFAKKASDSIVIVWGSARF